MRTRTAWPGRLLLVSAVLIAACGGAAPPASPGSAVPSSVASPSAAPSSAAPSAAPSSAPASASASAPVLDPERCPATLPAPDHQTADGILVDGDAAFVAHVEAALDLLKTKAADSYADVVASVSRISQVESFSGMCYDTGRYRVGEETAYAPGHTPENQVIWLAGTIVHDGRHRARFVEGLDPSGRDAELDCLQHQVEALRRIETGTYFGDYVQGLIDGVDDPANQYWTNPDRHW
jgi:hypothetical protein